MNSDAFFHESGMTILNRLRQRPRCWMPEQREMQSTSQGSFNLQRAVSAVILAALS
jgi:hypothetical protein